MILKGNQRGGANNLAIHLLKNENEHVEIHELRGFASDSLVSALNEAYAVSRGTRCKKFLFSLSLNPRLGKTSVLKNLRAPLRLSLARHIGRVWPLPVLQKTMVESGSGPWRFDGSGIKPAKASVTDR